MSLETGEDEATDGWGLLHAEAMPESTPQAIDQALHVDVLDGIRGFAALVVVAAHLSHATGVFAGHFSRAGGQLGVMLFFALSGFLLAHIYLQKPMTLAALRNYAAARIARVLPLFYLVVFASFLVSRTGFRLYDITSDNLADHLFLVSGVSVLWTIPVEIRFYCLFPLLWLAWRWSSALLAAGVTAVLIAYYLIEPGTMPIMKLGHYFLLGLLVRLLSPVGLRAIPQIMNGLFLLSLTIFALLLFHPLPVLNDPRIWWNPVAAVAVFGLLLGAIGSQVASWIFANGTMRFLGKISYGIYLLHMIVIINLQGIVEPTLSPVIFALLVSIITLVLAISIFHVFENPTRRSLRAVLGVARGKDVTLRKIW